MKIQWKKSKSILTIAALAVLLGACANKSGDSVEEDPVQVPSEDSEGSEATDEAMIDASAPIDGTVPELPVAMPEPEPTSTDIGTLDLPPTDSVVSSEDVPPVAVTEESPLPPLPPEPYLVVDDKVPEQALPQVPADVEQVMTDSDTIEYVIMPGDTLGKIAKKIYGGKKPWLDLASENGIKNPNKIFPGDKIQYRVDKAVAKFKKGSGQQLKVAKLKKGESLSKLALRLYGDASYWRVIWRMNQSVVKNPNRVKSGLELSYVKKKISHKAITH